MDLPWSKSQKMNTFQPLEFPQNHLGKILLYLMFMTTYVVSSQTTFTENATAYGLGITGSKDGGHAWADYDNDGDADVLVLENQGGSNRSYLMRNNGNNTFTDVRASLVPGMPNDNAERQAAWGDLNGDGRPDFMIGSHGNSNSNPIALQIYLQNTTGTFGDGIGGTAPITVGRAGYTININPINAEGAGFFDFEGDGDLDIFFDSHAHGIELLRNNYIDHVSHAVVNPVASALFTHITPGNGPGVVEHGLNQFATDGDFGSAADVNDDGWVDIFMRKRDENDFFLNQGGVFASGSDLAQAHNSNKGGNGLWDLDNDGDLDAVWTENDVTQIFRNDGPGIWVSLGATVFPGLPQSANSTGANSSAAIEALAGGDIDNDGDIDIILVGDSRSYLFINQLNSPTPAPGVIGSGAAMSFTLDAQTFNSGADGEGTTMIDIDDDGDLDIYMSINGRNRLYINQLPAANRNNHLIIDVTEDRGANGSTGGVPERVAIGTNVLIRDCNGNIISGLRQVNGVFGHGTQSPEQVHFGLPLGENETYVIEVRFPNFYDPVDGFTRLIGTIITTPSTIPGTNHYTFSTTAAELSENVNAPDAVDDLETVATGTSVSVQINLFDNDSEPDSESFFISSIVQPAIGSVVIDDAELGLVTYTYSAGTLFPGTTFEYAISDSPITTCPALGKSDTATVTIYDPCTDAAGLDTDGDGINDTCDLDDDNDGILDADEGCFTESADFSINQSSISLSLDNDSDGFVLDVTSIDNSFNMSINGNQLTSEEIEFHRPIRTAEFADGTFYGGGGVSNIWSIAWNNPTNPDTPLLRLIVNGDGSVELYGSKTHNGPLEPMVFINGLTVNPVSWNAGINTIILDQVVNGNTVMTGSLSSLVEECPLDTDGDGLLNNLDLDSDGDGCGDADEGYFGAIIDADSDNDGIYGTGTPTVNFSGLVSGASYTSPNQYFINSNANTCLDSDNDGVSNIVDLDDDNDGILDTTEHPKTVLWVLNGPITVDQQNTIDKLTSLGYTVTIADDNDTQNSDSYAVTYLHPSVNSGTAFANIANLATTTNGVITSENALFDEIMGTTGSVGNPSASQINIIDNTHPITQGLYLGNLDIGSGDYYVNNVLTGTQLGNHPDGTANLIAWEVGEAMDTGVAPGRRVAVPHTSHDGGFNTVGEDLLVSAILWAWALDTDGDGIYDDLDLDSDADSCNDVIEAGYTDDDGDGLLGPNPVTVDSNGLVTSGSDGYTTPADADTNLVFDFQEAGIAPLIIVQPTPLNLILCPGCSGTFDVTADNADGYQWQVLNGISWDDLTDSGIYSGTNSATLTVTNVAPSDNGNQYRVIVSSSTFVCATETSNTALLTVKATTVITNRRITYRVKKN